MTKSTQERLMQEALAIINGERQNAYGPPERNFERIGWLWSAYLKAANYTDCIGPIAVCHMLDLVKLARLIQTPGHEDSLRDRFGYNGCNVALALNDMRAEAQGAVGAPPFIKPPDPPSPMPWDPNTMMGWTYWPPSGSPDFGVSGSYGTTTSGSHGTTK